MTKGHAESIIFWLMVNAAYQAYSAGARRMAAAISVLALVNAIYRLIRDILISTKENDS